MSAVAFMKAMAPPFMPLSDINAVPPQLVEFMTGIRTQGVGEQMVLEQNVFVDGSMRHGRAGLSEEAMTEYNRPCPTPESRQIILDWPREIPMQGSPADVHTVVQANSDFVAEWIKENLTNIEAVYLSEGGHFIQEQYPDEIGKGLANWLTRV